MEARNPIYSKCLVRYELQPKSHHKLWVPSKNSAWFCYDVLACDYPEWVTCPAVKYEYEYLCMELTEGLFENGSMKPSLSKENHSRVMDKARQRLEILKSMMQDRNGNI